MSYIVNSLSLIIPAYNEESAIEETALVYKQKLEKIAKKYEIIIVDDGSNDRTPRILKKLKKQFSEVRVITHKKNLGVGKALSDGFKAAKCNWVMHNSADQPFDIDDLEKARALFTKSDVIVVEREDRSANSPIRKVTSLASLFLVKLLFGTNIKDFHFIQLYRRQILKGVKISSRDTFMPAELLVKLSKKNYTINQFKAKFHKRTAGYSKYDNPIRYVTYLRELIKFWFAMRK